MKREETKLKWENKTVRLNTEVIQKRVNMLFKEFTNETKERYRSEIGRRG